VSTKPPRRTQRPPDVGDASTTVIPTPEATAQVSGSSMPAGDQLDGAILRYLRQWPNRTVDLAPLAEQLGIDPFEVQLAVQRLHRRRMVVAPFIQPSAAGGATLSQKGSEWLLEREGGKPADTPIAFQMADRPVRASDEAARLPRAQVYGVRR
jgi:hypothetical protein